MKFNITADTNWETKIDHALKVFDRREINKKLSLFNYGNDLEKIVVVLMCRDPSLNHTQRIKLDKKTKTLYIDVMLSYSNFTISSHKERRKGIVDNTISEMKRVLKNYSFKNFVVDKYVHDLETLLRLQLVGPESNRYDHLCLQQASNIDS